MSLLSLQLLFTPRVTFLCDGKKLIFGGFSQSKQQEREIGGYLVFFFGTIYLFIHNMIPNMHEYMPTI